MVVVVAGVLREEAVVDVAVAEERRRLQLVVVAEGVAEGVEAAVAKERGATCTHR